MRNHNCISMLAHDSVRDAATLWRNLWSYIHQPKPLCAFAPWRIIPIYCKSSDARFGNFCTIIIMYVLKAVVHSLVNTWGLRGVINEIPAEEIVKPTLSELLEPTFNLLKFLGSNFADCRGTTILTVIRSVWSEQFGQRWNTLARSNRCCVVGCYAGLRGTLCTTVSFVFETLYEHPSATSRRKIEFAAKVLQPWDRQFAEVTRNYRARGCLNARPWASWPSRGRFLLILGIVATYLFSSNSSQSR